ncbi:hypothetical protein, partial [Xanthobacter versatilis]|uniref:hypothetical protein n=1 Tax=Xanthobacter autotrophicus (strain ATCC BAA-1158 / Py2) TaxID=78245 RepID=UPI003728A1BD
QNPHRAATGVLCVQAPPRRQCSRSNATPERPSNLPHKPVGELQALGLPPDSRAVDPMLLREGRIDGVGLKMLKVGGERGLDIFIH